MTVRHGGHRLWLLLYGGFCGLAVAFVSARWALAGAQGVPPLPVTALVVGAACLYARRARIDVDDDALTIVNPWSRHRLGWAQVADVRVGDVAGVAHPIEVLDTAGRVRRSFGVMEVRIAVPPSPALQRIARDLAARRR